MIGWKALESLIGLTEQREERGIQNGMEEERRRGEGEGIGGEKRR